MKRSVKSSELFLKYSSPLAFPTDLKPFLRSSPSAVRGQFLTVVLITVL